MTGLIMNLTPSIIVITTEKLPIVPLGTRLETKLPTAVKRSTEIIITMPFLMSRFLFLPKVYALTPLARTSLARAIPTASYAGIPRKAISTGLIAAAALIPAKPVPIPAADPAKKQTINLYNMGFTQSLPNITLYYRKDF
jgi:hypothetical protein